YRTMSVCVLTAPAPTALYTLSLHDALPISRRRPPRRGRRPRGRTGRPASPRAPGAGPVALAVVGLVVLDLVIIEIVIVEFVIVRSEEHTSELQSRENLVCRLLLEKKNKIHC